ncbi:hypothetical protein A5626_17735 [Mycobacterium marseillense]|uniref:hypothetical protein n=1 Tax=Mycobacterium marseillense TaxID=701042 RepID=UPI0007FD09C8|nr:hypothetical protein [Mycobacterium marseillense]MCA2263965.1 hypothetical protein [Mycobacterium marseillense]OBJ75993.1 hypothetical protein A5626_17735 [Mycobacterium marseillense]
MDQRDYSEAWELISSQPDGDFREERLAALRASERRPYVAIAMIRIGALLAKITSVADGFADQLSQSTYAHIEEGILNITDQILVPARNLPDVDEDLLNGIPISLAKQEMAASQAEDR